jgi:dTMP kinase
MNKQPEILKNFLVLEGLDGAGTTTQAKLLQRRCAEEGCASVLMREPSAHAAGLCIRSILRGEAAALPETLAYLFAADRNEHVFGPGGIAEEARAGRLVICDRYLFSSLAYQSVDCGERLVWSLNRRFPLPEFLVFLEISPQTGEERLASRSEREIFEYTEFQTRAAAAYRHVLEEFAPSGMKILKIDGKRRPEDIHAEIWNFLSKKPILKT